MKFRFLYRRQELQRQRRKIRPRQKFRISKIQDEGRILCLYLTGRCKLSRVMYAMQLYNVVSGIYLIEIYW